MKNQKTKVILFLGVLFLVILGLVWENGMLEKEKLTPNTATPTVTASVQPTSTPKVDTRVTEYTSVKAHLKLTFKQPMYVRDDTESPTRGWIVVSMNPIDPENTQANGLIIDYQSPSIEGKGGACEPGNYHANSILGQTVMMCEDQNRMSLAYLMNKNAKTEYAFFIESKGVTEYKVYKAIITDGLTLR